MRLCFLTAHQTPASVIPRRNRVATSIESYTSSSSDDRIGPSIDLFNLNQHLSSLSPTDLLSASSSHRSSSTSYSSSFSTSNKMTGAENLDALRGDHEINAVALPEGQGQLDQVIDAFPLAHLHTERLSDSDASASSGSPSQDAFAYRTIGPAILLKSYQPKHSSVGSTSSGKTTPEQSRKDFEKVVLPPFLYCSDSIYPEPNLAGPDILDMADNNPTMSFLDIDQELLANPTEQAYIPGPDSASLDPDEILGSHVYSGAHGPTQPFSFGNTDCPENPSPPPAYRPQSVDALVPVPQGPGLASHDNTSDSVGDSSSSQFESTSEMLANSTSEVDTNLTLPTLLLPLPQADLAGCHLTEIQDDLVCFENGDALDEKHLTKDLSEVTSDGDQPPPSEFSSSDTLNGPASSELIISHAKASATPSTSTADASGINLVEKVNTSVTDCAPEAVPQACEVPLNSHVASACRRESLSESSTVQLPQDARTDQSPVTTLEPHHASSTLTNSEPLESANTLRQPPASANHSTKVPEDFLIVSGLNPEQSPVSPIPPTPADTPVPDDKSPKTLEPPQAHKDPNENSPVSLPPNGPDLPTIAFPTSRPVEGSLNNWSLHPTTRMSSSTEIVDPLLRSNIFREAVREPTSLPAVVESQVSATEAVQTSESGPSKRTLRARSISVFFKSINKKDPVKADSAHSASLTSTQSSDEDIRPGGTKTLPKRKSFGMLRRKSGLLWVNRGHDEPVPALPEPYAAHVSKDHQLKNTCHTDDQLKIIESVESKNPPIENSNTNPSISPLNQESTSERSFPAAATAPPMTESKMNKSPRKFKISLAKKYFKSDPARVAPTTALHDTLEGPFAAVIGGIGYSPSADRPNTLRKRRTASTHVPSPMLKDLRLTGLFSKILGRKNHADDILGRLIHRDPLAS